MSLQSNVNENIQLMVKTYLLYFIEANNVVTMAQKNKQISNYRYNKLFSMQRLDKGRKKQ